MALLTLRFTLTGNPSMLFLLVYISRSSGTARHTPFQLGCNRNHRRSIGGSRRPKKRLSWAWSKTRESSCCHLRRYYILLTAATIVERNPVHFVRHGLISRRFRLQTTKNRTYQVSGQPPYSYMGSDQCRIGSRQGRWERKGRHTSCRIWLSCWVFELEYVERCPRQIILKKEAPWTKYSPPSYGCSREFRTLSWWRRRFIDHAVLGSGELLVHVGVIEVIFIVIASKDNKIVIQPWNIRLST